MVGIQIKMALFVLGAVFVTSVQSRALTRYRILSKYDWDEAEKLCPGSKEGLLALMRTLDKNRPCPPYKDITDDYEDWSMKARFEGPVTGVEKRMKDGNWKSYHLIGCCYT